ncbi:MAG: LuxR family transcriptional regulator [OCS116 cluster bacterium]|nr:LuxR family transcriptional regulator [OCS116 cluster bacterium]
MNIKLQLFLTELDVADTRDEVWKIITKFYAGYGFDSIIYVDMVLDDVEILTSLPQYWHDHYVDQNYQEIDPFFSYCSGSLLSINTGKEYLSQYDCLNNPAKKLICEAAEVGFCSGFSVIYKPLSVAGAGGWNIGSSLDKKQVEKIKKQHLETLQLASFFAREAIQRAPQKNTETPIFSKREKECLLWLATGLRTKQIAHKLNLKPVSIELYINNAKKKLNATTREQLIAKAITQKQIAI